MQPLNANFKLDQSVLAIHDSPLYYEISEDDHPPKPLSCIITGGPAPILRSVNEVSAKTWRILMKNDAISMTTLTLFS